MIRIPSSRSIRSIRRLISAVLFSLLLSVSVILFLSGSISCDKDIIRYAEFNPSYSALKKAMEIDIESFGTDHHLSWTDSLAYISARCYDDYSRYSEKDLSTLYSRIKSGEKMDRICSGLKNFNYYHEVYSAVLGGLLGEYEYTAEDNTVKKKYGLKAYLPIAEGFAYSEYDDFGASRSYGFKRRHLGHDMICETGTPVICIEDGTVECMGWNQYGGWRIGIRSRDKKRYYYYAHLRKNRPYHCDLSVGKNVSAGDVIGYAGRTGYSAEENVNNIETPHLHWGLELIFDESQKECDNEIWVDLYAVTRLLSSHRADVIRDPETKEFYHADASVQGAGKGLSG